MQFKPKNSLLTLALILFLISFWNSGSDKVFFLILSFVVIFVDNVANKIILIKSEKWIKELENHLINIDNILIKSEKWIKDLENHLIMNKNE